LPPLPAPSPPPPPSAPPFPTRRSSDLRGISARTRNVRLAAIHSFFKYAAFHQPAHSALIQRVLAMPSKRYHKSAIEFLSRSEIEDRKSTRLNSSHQIISYAVFCLKKKI